MNRIISILAAFLALTLGSELLFAQQGNEEKKVFIIPGDLNKAYEIVDEVFYVRPVEVDVLGTYEGAFNDAVKEAFKVVKDAVKKSQGDMVINTQLNFVLYPAAKRQVIGQLTLYGTLVKTKPETGK